MGLTLYSAAFSDGGDIPRGNTCDGLGHSPPVFWRGAPLNVGSFSLICTAPDVPGYIRTHWLIWNIPADVERLPEGMPIDETIMFGDILQGKNSFGGIGYRGPAPFRFGPRRYLFRLYALDALLDLPPGAARRTLLKEMRDHIITWADLTGYYGRLSPDDPTPHTIV